MEREKIRSTFTIGEIDISGFSYETVYELKEISSPDGYIIANDSTYFKAIHENTNTYLRLTDQNGIVLVKDNDDPIIDNDRALVSENTLAISIKNEPGAALPNTGGSGTNLIYLLGIMLTGISGMGLEKRRRKKRHNRITEKLVSLSEISFS